MSLAISHFGEVLMGCFIAPVTQAVITTIVCKVVEAKEKKAILAGEVKTDVFPNQIRIPFSRKMKWLSNMLWGGSALLLFEHVWHGEVTPVFPFFTAANSSEMLMEVSTVGVGMAVLVTLAWGVMVLVSNAIEKKAAEPLSESAVISQEV